VANPVIITAALNGNRGRAEHPGLLITATEIAVEAARCRDAGASIIHVHARAADGSWTADLNSWRETMLRLRDTVPDALISMTSLRPEGVPGQAVLDLVTGLAADPRARPDLISVNLGHGVVWEPRRRAGTGRTTRHYPNSYDDIARMLSLCAELGIRPELGVMDLGFISNAVTLRNDGLLPARPWFLVELDSSGYGAGEQVAPSTIANYTALATPLREYFPGATWCVHGNGVAGYAVIERALANGAHIRVGFEDAVLLPDGSTPNSNADLVAWAVEAAARHGRKPATLAETRELLAGSGASDEVKRPQHP
jgi:3-keto-5-aminohexanoate cleavage enzyme